MARVDVVDESIELDEPTMVEGLPGVGLVGKIAADHLIGEFDMSHYANLLCESLPKVAVYDEGQRPVSPPVRLYAAPEQDLVALQSDVPIAPAAAEAFADCVAGWFESHDAMPLYLSGLPQEKSGAPPAMYGVATGDAGDRLDAAGIDRPTESGMVSGPTGALLHQAFVADVAAVGLVVESDPQFPDPEAARVLIKEGIEPLAGVEVAVDDLVERAEEIREAKEQLAQRMREADQEATQARRIRGYQ